MAKNKMVNPDEMTDDLTPATEAGDISPIEAARIARAEAKQRIRAWIDAQEDKDDPFVHDIILAVGTGRRARVSKGPRITDTMKLRQDFIDNGFLTKLYLFETYEFGKLEMKIKQRAFVKAKPEDRIYIDYDEERGGYVLLGTGPTPPEGYTGYLPANTKKL